MNIFSMFAITVLLVFAVSVIIMHVIGVLLNLKGRSFYKSFIIVLLQNLAAIVINIVIGTISFFIPNAYFLAIWQIFGLLISIVISYFVLHFLLRHYYQISWLKSLLAYILQGFVNIVLIIILVLIISFNFKPFIIDGNSMDPAYKNGEIWMTTTFNKSYQRGEVVIMSVPYTDKYYIKRIVGLPGESLEVKDNQIFINGQLYAESYIHGSSMDYPPVALKEYEYFVMGDNRNNSSYDGVISKNRFFSKPWFKYWPMR